MHDPLQSGRTFLSQYQTRCHPPGNSCSLPRPGLLSPADTTYGSSMISSRSRSNNSSRKFERRLLNTATGPP